MNAPSWIPRSPDELLTAAAQLERYWADLERRGYVKPSLADELAFLEQYHGVIQDGA